MEDAYFNAGVDATEHYRVDGKSGNVFLIDKDAEGKRRETQVSEDIANRIKAGIAKAEGTKPKPY